MSRPKSRASARRFLDLATKRRALFSALPSSSRPAGRMSVTRFAERTGSQKTLHHNKSASAFNWPLKTKITDELFISATSSLELW